MCVHVSALLKDEMFLLSLSCTSRTVNGISGRIDPPPSSTDFPIRVLIGGAAVPMAFSRLIWLGLITEGITVIQVIWDQLCVMSPLRLGGKRKITQKKRKLDNNKVCIRDTGEQDVEVKVLGGKKHPVWCQVVLPQLEVGRLCRVAEVNTHGNRHWGLWLQPFCKWEEGGGEKKGVSDKGTVCSVGKNKAEGESSSRVEQTGIRTTCVFYFTKQGHRVWEIYLSISFHTPRAPQKRGTYAGLAYF